MRLATSILGITLLLIAMMMATAGSPATRQDQTKPLYRPTGSEGTLSGTISFTGKPPQPKLIDTSADPVCQEFNLFNEEVPVNGKLANVFVYVKSGDALDWYSFEATTADVSLAHQGCRFVPHLIGMQPQQILKILNQDTTPHNTHFTPKANADWNQSQPPNSAPLEKKFNRPEVMIPVKCNQHPWERAYVAVLSHPFFSITAIDGSYQIAGLPPGKYTLGAWYESFGEKTVEVSVGVGDLKKVDFTFSSRSSENSNPGR